MKGNKNTRISYNYLILPLIGSLLITVRTNGINHCYVPLYSFSLDTTPQKKTTINGNSVTVQGQPANINTGTNNGIIGNNNQVTVVPDKPIIFTDADKANLLKLINENFAKLPIDKRNCISIISMMGNKTSMKVSNIIADYINSTGFPADKVDIGQGMSSNTTEGIFVGIRHDCVTIDVQIY